MYTYMHAHSHVCSTLYLALYFLAGVPTLILAAASMDDVIAISLFGVFLGLAFSEG